MTLLCHFHRTRTTSIYMPAREHAARIEDSPQPLSNDYYHGVLGSFYKFRAMTDSPGSVKNSNK